ncbi:MAG TPA: KH domain-containing protein [Blastocatellia bacterium]|nr:KH domain-containing protein [Blastocatellia bacterium]
MKELIQQMVAALVDHPEAIKIREIQGEASIVFELQVGPGEMGKIIGKHGRTARSLRTIVSAAGMKIHKRARLELLENSAGARSVGAGLE